MEIRTRLCISVDGYVSTPDGWPVQLADPNVVPGNSYGFQSSSTTATAVGPFAHATALARAQP